MPEIQGWHFIAGPLPGTLRDGRPAPPDGEWLTHDGPVRMCNSGLHFSRRVLDALAYAPGSVLCRIAVEEVVAEEGDKGVCRRRRIDWRIDAESILWTCARLSAARVSHLLPPETAPVVREWLATGREDLRAAARAAAGDAAGDAATAAGAAAGAAWASGATAWAAAEASAAWAAWAAGDAATAAGAARAAIRAAGAAAEADLLRLIEEVRNA